MIKYFLKVLFTLLFLNLLSKIAFGSVTLLTPLNGQVLEDRLIHYTWHNSDRENEYIYNHFLFLSGTLRGGGMTTIVEQEEHIWGVADRRIYLWNVQYHPKSTFEGVFEYESEPYIFSVNKEIPQEMLDEFLRPSQEENIQEEEVKEEKKEEELIVTISEKEQEKEEVQDENEMEFPFLENIPELIPLRIFPLQNIVSSTQESEFNWNVSSSKQVLGEMKDLKKSEIVCKFKYLKRGNTLEKIYCNIPKLELEQESKYQFADEYSIFLKGRVQPTFNIQIDEYICNFNILKPTTWFKCDEIFVKSKTIYVIPNMFFNIFNQEKRVSVKSFFLEENTFRLLAGHVKDTNNLRLVHTYRMVSSEYDLYHEEKTEYVLNVKDLNEEMFSQGHEKKPFSFPFERIIGVTQWYGYTAYQSPHAGIDFGARQESVLAVQDGEVVSKGWDGYEGKCLSGGKYLIVKHSNGMHTTYFHLEDMYVNTGDVVKRGQNIARSGNTGAWNCQTLGYHLHFETRLNSSSSSHQNPVKYVDVDWNTVTTLGYERHPGRLSGENPHPGW